MREALIVGRSDILYLLLNPAQHCNVSHPAILGYHYTSLYNLSCSVLLYCALLFYLFTVYRTYDTAAPAL